MHEIYYTELQSNDQLIILISRYPVSKEPIWYLHIAWY